MIATANELGIGIYTPQEAAMYARVHTQTLTRWLFGNKRGQSVVKSQIQSDDDKTVTFVDFIQSLAIRAIRTQYGGIVSLQKIREAAEEATHKYGVEFPFARPHVTFVITEGKHAGEVVLRLKEDRFVQVTGKKKDQHLIGPIAELFLEDVAFDDGDDGYAKEYRPWSTQEGGAILMNPHRRFGEPIVEGCGYSARTLWEATIAEGGIKSAASAYGVTQEHVKLACSYYDHLLSVSA